MSLLTFLSGATPEQIVEVAEQLQGVGAHSALIRLKNLQAAKLVAVDFSRRQSSGGERLYFSVTGADNQEYLQYSDTSNPLGRVFSAHRRFSAKGEDLLDTLIEQHRRQLRSAEVDAQSMQASMRG